MTEIDKKRGRYRLELVTKSGRKDGAAWMRRFHGWRDRLDAESPLPASVEKEARVEALADLLVQKQYFRELLSLGKLSSEESRAMSGMASSIRHHLADLQLTSAVAAGAGPKPSTKDL